MTEILCFAFFVYFVRFEATLDGHFVRFVATPEEHWTEQAEQHGKYKTSGRIRLKDEIVSDCLLTMDPDTWKR